MTYVWLCVIFVLVALAVFLVAWLSSGRPRQLAKTWWLPIVAAGVVVMVLTAVFDNVMIGTGLMTYADTHISGLLIGAAPLEDFTYPLAGLLLLPALWLLLGRGRAGER